MVDYLTLFTKGFFNSNDDFVTLLKNSLITVFFYRLLQNFTSHYQNLAYIASFEMARKEKLNVNKFVSLTEHMETLYREVRGRYQNNK